MVELHESNVGILTLYREGDDVAYVGVEMANSTFAVDADALAAGDTDDWRVPTICMRDTNDPLVLEVTRGDSHVATWADGHVTLERTPGIAAARYLGLDE